MAYDNFLVDKRVVERNIAKGLVDSDELKRQIEGLPDRESNCVHVSLDATGAQLNDATDDATDYDDASDDEDDDDDEEDDEDDDEAADEPAPQG